MKKSMVLLFTIAMSIMVLLSACERDNPAADVNINTNPSTIPTDPSINTNPDANQNSNGQNSPQGEVTDSEEAVYGFVKKINGMEVTINASGMMVFFDPEAYITDGSAQKIETDTIIRLTEKTEIVVNTNRGGQIVDTKAGTVDDISIGNIVIAYGEWQGDEFVVTKVTVSKIS